jgi:hypothetical protein
MSAPPPAEPPMPVLLNMARDNLAQAITAAIAAGAEVDMGNKARRARDRARARSTLFLPLPRLARRRRRCRRSARAH